MKFDFLVIISQKKKNFFTLLSSKFGFHLLKEFKPIIMIDILDHICLLIWVTQIFIINFKTPLNK
jgi:hypothetical protein